MPPEEAALEKLLSGERSVARARLATFVFLAVVYLLRLDPDAGAPRLAAMMLLVVGAGAGLTAFHRPSRMLVAAVPRHLRVAVGSLFVTLLVLATGGAASPFYLLYFVHVVGVAFRFGTRETWLAALANSVGYAAVFAFSGASWPDAAVRIGFLLLVAAHAALLTREAVRQANAPLELGERVQEARPAEARFRGLLEAAPDSMVIVDRDGRIVLVNSETERVFGYPRDELLGKPLSALVSAQRDAGVQDSPMALVGGETIGQRRNGSTFPAEVRMSPFETESGRLYTSTIRDLTDRKRAEEERLASHERLAELERLRELDQLKAAFINTAAHELGTPLTPIKLQLHLLKNAKPDGLSEQQARSLVILERNVNRLHELVKDVLDVARLQASRLGLRRERVDLNRLVLEATESYQENARQAGVQLAVRLTPDVVVEADADRLTQVLFNLLSNAFKFTPRDGRITVETLRATPDHALVRVSDTGFGLKPEDADHLFQPFSQVHDRAQKTRSGSGLGLYISRGIVELHGGRMWVESEGPGLGSTFSFTLPFRAPQAAPAAAPETSTAA